MLFACKLNKKKKNKLDHSWEMQNILWVREMYSVQRGTDTSIELSVGLPKCTIKRPRTYVNARRRMYNWLKRLLIGSIKAVGA